MTDKEILDQMKPINLETFYYPVVGMKNLYFQTDDGVIRHGKYDFNYLMERRWIDDDNNIFSSNQILKWMTTDEIPYYKGE